MRKPIQIGICHSGVSEKRKAEHARLVERIKSLNGRHQSYENERQRLKDGPLSVDTAQAMQGVRLIQIELLQEEVDIRNDFEVWLDGYPDELREVSNKAHVEPEANKAKIRKDLEVVSKPMR
jgi:hypothetical protein